MFKKLLHFLLIFPLFLSAQELDQSFLESLPEDMQKDIEKSIQDKESETNPV